MADASQAAPDSCGRGTAGVKRSRKKASWSNKVLMCITDCKYEVVREAAHARGWELVDEDPEAGVRKCHVYWVDVPAVVERMQQLRRWQRINHFPGMCNVARKGRLAQNLDRMRRSFPREFSFYPRTWVLPVEWGAFKMEFDASGKSSRVFIIKPDSGCQGRGIFLTQDLNRVASMENQVAQLYVRRPLLIDGFKFDLRVYVLVTSVIPLRVYVFRDGLVRLCTEEYIRPASDNLGERCMHLTNYAVNKSSDNFVANEGSDREHVGSKRSLRWLLEWISSERGQERADALWRRMCSACVKTLVSILPTLHREYLRAFGPDQPSLPEERATEGAGGRTGSGRDDGEGDTPASLSGPPRQSSREQGDVAQYQGGQGLPDPARGTSTFASSQDCTESLPRGQIASETGRSSSVEQASERASATVRGGTIPDDARGDFGDGVIEGSRCVEILGLDFMVDEYLKPWLIEVNHLPSFATDSPLDKRIKSRIVGAAMSILRAKAEDRRSYEGNSKRDAQSRLYNPDTKAESARESERKKTEAILTDIRRKVEAIYSRFAPHKMGRVPHLFDKYAGDEARLLRLVRRKYIHAEGNGTALTTACEGAMNGGDHSAPAHGSDVARVESCPAETQAPPGVVYRSDGLSNGYAQASAGEGDGQKGSSQGKICTKVRTSNRSESWPQPSKPGVALQERERGRKREAGTPNLAPAHPWTAPVRGEEDELGKLLCTHEEAETSSHDPADLCREAEALEGWERLHPSPCLLSMSNTETTGAACMEERDRTSSAAPNAGMVQQHEEERDENMCNTNAHNGAGIASSVGKRSRKAVSIEAMMRQAFEDDHKMTMRLRCPLQQQRGGVVDRQPTTTLPHIGPGAAAKVQKREVLAVCDPEQREKAQRLMEGYSCGRRRSASAPTRGGENSHSQLPASLKMAVLRAKEWRRRLNQGNTRRTTRSLALKVHTFDFDGPKDA